MYLDSGYHLWWKYRSAPWSLLHSWDVCSLLPESLPCPVTSWMIRRERKWKKWLCAICIKAARVCVRAYTCWSHVHDILKEEKVWQAGYLNKTEQYTLYLPVEVQKARKVTALACALCLSCKNEYIFVCACHGLFASEYRCRLLSSGNPRVLL